ncbi:MAG: hypothetical protein IKY52_08605 [Clostridia bacterium]|nr:hypothetical protein [Clostridia bacterium]
MQANLQNAVIYYKNVETDTYMQVESEMQYARDSSTVKAEATSLGEVNYLFPYRSLTTSEWKRQAKNQFPSFFRSMCGYMFFDTGDNIVLEVPDMENYLIAKYLTVHATQTVKPAVSLALVGLPDEFEISATARIGVTNPDEIIRNIDFVVDILADTKIGEIAKDIAGKVGDLYDKFVGEFGDS